MERPFSPTRVLRMLTTLEPTVESLMTLKYSAPILKEKLVQMEDLISDLPDTKETVAEEWRDKLAFWWRGYANVVANEEEMFQQQSASTSFYGTSLNLSTYSRNPPRSPSPHSIYEVESCKLQSEVSVLLERQFMNIPELKSPSDINGMKMLISAIVRSFEWVPPKMKNPVLQSTFFRLVYDKFPDSLRELFTMQFTKYTVYSLFNFLRLEIEDQLNDRSRFLIETTPPAPTAEAAALGDCLYCHQNGHITVDCTELFCLVCYQIGHNKLTCKRGSLFK